MAELPKYLQELNPNQLEAAQSIYGPVLIQAGAGSGKTKTVIARIMNMIDHGINPATILAITFTNKAARELKDRIKQTGNENANNVTACTIHHLCLTILMRFPFQDPYVQTIQHNHNFNIIDNTDQKRIVRSCRDDILNSDEAKETFDEGTLYEIKHYDPQNLINYINAYKKFYLLNELHIGAPHFKFKPEDRSLSFYIRDVIKKYIEYTASNHLIDFDDMLYDALFLLKTQPNALKQLQQQYQYISVDEYQDTSAVQEELINMLADTPQQNLCVVGDPNQSIYAFRGADISNILEFPKKHHNAHIITLNINYRSTQSILDFANEGIARNPNPYHSKVSLKAIRDNQVKPAIFEAVDRYDQAKTIADIIDKKIKNDNANPSNFAVLYRNNRSGLEMQTVLTEYGIPFETNANQNLYAHAVIKDLLAYLSLIQNHNDDDALLRIINTPSRGIGMTTIQVLKQLRDQLPNHSIFEIACHLHELRDGLKQHNIKISDRVINSVSQFTKLISKINILGNATLMSLLKYLLDECGYGAYVQALDSKNDSETNQELVDSFLLFANKFDLDHENISLYERLTGFSTMIKMNELNDEKEKNKDAVHLSTIHSAKGLEYDTVFIIDVANNILPSKRAVLAKQNYTHPNEKPFQEERRLFYVAVTRAKNELYISYARTIRDFHGNVMTEHSSPFINNLEPNTYRKIDSYNAKRTDY